MDKSSISVYFDGALVCVCADVSQPGGDRGLHEAPGSADGAREEHREQGNQH